MLYFYSSNTCTDIFRSLFFIIHRQNKNMTDSKYLVSNKINDSSCLCNSRIFKQTKVTRYMYEG